MEEGKLGHLTGEVIELATNDPSLNGYMKIPLSLRGSSILWSQQLGSLIFFTNNQGCLGGYVRLLFRFREFISNL